MIYIWRPPSLSELTPIISNMELTHLGLDASINIDLIEYHCFRAGCFSKNNNPQINSEFIRH